MAMYPVETIKFMGIIDTFLYAIPKNKKYIYCKTTCLSTQAQTTLPIILSDFTKTVEVLPFSCLIDNTLGQIMFNPNNIGKDYLVELDFVDFNNEVK